MKKEIPPGTYNVTLIHHPNQKKGVYVANIVENTDGFSGMGFCFQLNTICVGPINTIFFHKENPGEKII